MSTMREVAARAGVSAKTVSRVINDDPYVSEGVRRRVRQAIDELQYLPNTLARTFRSGRDAFVGVAVPDLSDPFFATVVHAVERVARSRRTSVLVTSLGNDPADERGAVEALLSRQVAGLVATPVAADQSYLKPWQARTALVFIDRVPSRLSADSVVEDDHGGALAATAHLVGHGHRRIGFIGDALSVSTTARRFGGYRAALSSAGLPPDDRLTALGIDSPGAAVAAARRLLGLADPPTALFSSNARCSIALVPALQALGRTDVALVSFGDFPLADALTPALTVVDQDPDAVGTMAATRLFDRLDHPERRFRRRTVLPVRLVPRSSCCSPDEIRSSLTPVT